MQSSPFLAGLRTIFHPSEAEASHIHEIIDQCEIELGVLAVKLGRAQEIVDQSAHEANEEALSLVDHLSHDQAKLRTYLAAHRSLLSPIRRLPPEILSEIFWHCLPDGRFIKPVSREAPLLLGQVCTLWRDVALSTPKLWSSLEMTVGKNCSLLTDTWLSRTGACPLSLSLLSPPPPRHPFKVENSLRVLDIMGRSPARWQHIAVSLPFWHCLIIPVEPLSALETFHIHIADKPTEDMSQQLSTALSSAPRLREVVWHSHNGHIELPWAQLDSLILTVPLSVSRCLDILQQSPNLKHFSFEGKLLPSPLPHFQESVLLPQLSNFTMSIGQPLDFLDELTCPNLRELKFSGGPMDIVHWSQESFASFLVRSRCALERLHLHYAPISDTELIECLRQTNNTLLEVTVQTWGDVIATEDFFSVLTYKHHDDGDSGHLSPKLEVLALYDCTTATEGAFANMVESRLKLSNDDGGSPVCISSIKVIESFDNHVDVARLKELRKQGLTLKLYDPFTGKLSAD